MISMVLAEIGTVSPTPPPGLGDKINLLLSWGIWAAVIACVVGLIAAGAYLAYSKTTGQGGDSQSKILGAMVGAAIVATAGTIINTIVL